VCTQAGMPGSIPVYHRNHHQSQTEHPQKWLSVGGGEGGGGSEKDTESGRGEGVKSGRSYTPVPAFWAQKKASH
jgi:hypothetical protein